MPNHNPLDNSMWQSLVANRPVTAGHKASPYSPFKDARQERLEYQAQRLQEMVDDRSDATTNPDSPFQNGRVERMHRLVRQQFNLLDQTSLSSEQPTDTNQPKEQEPT